MEDIVKQRIEEIFKKVIPENVLLFKSIEEVNHRPHRYTIGPRHISYASDRYGGILGKETCQAVQCAHPRCLSTYEEHVHDTVICVQLPRDVTTSELKKSMVEFQEVLLNVISEIYPQYKTIESILDGWTFVDTPEKFRVIEDKEGTDENV